MNGLIDRVLKFIDKPWKAITVVVLMILCGIGWFIYTERARIADRMLGPPFVVAKLKTAAFTDDVQRLLRDTHGDAALLTELMLLDNEAIDRLGYDREGNQWLPVQGQRFALDPATPMPLVIRLLHNEVVCTDVKTTAASEEIQTQAALGMKRTCIVLVPPLIGVTVGLLMVSWREPLSPSNESKAMAVMVGAAMKYATW